MHNKWLQIESTNNTSQTRTFFYSLHYTITNAIKTTQKPNNYFFDEMFSTLFLFCFVRLFIWMETLFVFLCSATTWLAMTCTKYRLRACCCLSGLCVLAWDRQAIGDSECRSSVFEDYLKQKCVSLFPKNYFDCVINDWQKTNIWPQIQTTFWDVKKHDISKTFNLDYSNNFQTWSFSFWGGLLFVFSS